jgi:predicted RNA-binding Zn-ribbon protein involved in translation (DUF1610 family)
MWSCECNAMAYNEAAATVLAFECPHCGNALFNERGEQHSNFDDPEQVLPSEY